MSCIVCCAQFPYMPCSCTVHALCTHMHYHNMYIDHTSVLAVYHFAWLTAPNMPCQSKCRICVSRFCQSHCSNRCWPNGSSISSHARFRITVSCMCARCFTVQDDPHACRSASGSIPYSCGLLQEVPVSSQEEVPLTLVHLGL